MSEMPSTIEMMKNLTVDMIKVIKQIGRDETWLVTPEKAAERFEICKSCDLFNEKDNRCTKCGCFMKKKVLYKAVSCPIGKWSEQSG